MDKARGVIAGPSQKESEDPFENVVNPLIDARLEKKMQDFEKSLLEKFSEIIDEKLAGQKNSSAKNDANDAGGAALGGINGDLQDMRKDIQTIAEFAMAQGEAKKQEKEESTPSNGSSKEAEHFAAAKKRLGTILGRSTSGQNPK